MEQNIVVEIDAPADNIVIPIDNVLPGFNEKVVEYFEGDDLWRLVVSFKKNSGECDFTNRLNNIASKNGVSDNRYKRINNNSKTIGMVFYMESGYSRNIDENYEIHIPQASRPSPYAVVIQKMINAILGYKVRQVIVGHEHGDLNGKCHLQVAVEFNEKITKLLNPGKVCVIKNNVVLTTMLFMQQVSYSSYKLKEYCKKDGDFTLLDESLNIVEVKNDKDKLDVFKTIVENKEKLTSEDALEMLQRKTSREYFVNFANVNKAVRSLICDPLPEFKWGDFSYLKEFTIPMGNMRVGFYPIFKKWFDENCVANPERKIALCLYSAKRGLGKTMFARNMVNNKGYLLEYNNTFDERGLTTEEPYKLLLLDDMKDIDSKNVQMWRSLVASQKTTIRDAYCNEIYDLGLPCVITTNSVKMITRFTKDPLFYTQVITIEIDSYMGPPGTYDERLYKRQCFVSDYTNNIVRDEEIRESKKPKSEKF